MSDTFRAGNTSQQVPSPTHPLQTQGQVQGQRQVQGQPFQHKKQVADPSSQPLQVTNSSSSQHTFENFHLDPQDFQNFLLINPPLTEYSSHCYMNFNKAQPDSLDTDQLLDQLLIDKPDLNPITPPISNNDLTINNNTQTQQQHVVSQNLQQPMQSMQQQYSNLASQFDLVDQNMPLPTRRLSISNGQIGQISMMVHSQLQPEQISLQQTPTQPQEQQQHQTYNSVVKQEMVTPSTSITTTPVAMNNVPAGAPIEVDKNGIPTRELIYENQVIFNPNGPIPGTNAWKRAKILERNRIAASKCRAKKKNLQKKLEEDVSRLNEEKASLLKMLEILKGRVLRYCNKNGVDPEYVMGSDELIKEHEVKVKIEEAKRRESQAGGKDVANMDPIAKKLDEFVKK